MARTTVSLYALNHAQKAGVFFNWLLFAALIVFAAGCGDSAPQIDPMQVPINTDGRIHFKLGKTRFNVPEAYLTGAAHSGSGRPE
ncbi:MAG: hypothetical protein GY862_06180, partial [Gammaproteobacteria bacterium]|nr:hypothetical protein [Gammaproteobacteria bacterium]